MYDTITPFSHMDEPDQRAPRKRHESPRNSSEPPPINDSDRTTSGMTIVHQEHSIILSNSSVDTPFHDIMDECRFERLNGRFIVDICILTLLEDMMLPKFNPLLPHPSPEVF
jgi:hypothetical protein